MEEPAATLALWDYRRRVEGIYASVREALSPAEAWDRWRLGRHDLFRQHPQSPIPAEKRSSFRGLEYFPYDPGWRHVVEVRPVPDNEINLANSGAGTTRFRRFGKVAFDHAGATVELTLLWLESYGGGVFLSFRDQTNGTETYGGGRYLIDTCKGADLGWEEGLVVLDFNFAYHPSCVHDPMWSCPLSPPENRLLIRVGAGERLDL